MPLPFLMAVFPAHAAAAAAPSGAAITLSGSLSATASASTITSTARTVTVPPGSSGVMQFTGVADIGDGGTLRVRKNSDAYQAVFEGGTLAFADADTITLTVINAVNVGDGVQVNLVDNTNGSAIQTAALFRV